MSSRNFWTMSLLGSILTLVFFFLTSVPLGIPEEWVWNRIDYSDAGATIELISNLTMFAFVAIPWLLFVRWGTRQIDFAASRKWLLLGLTLFSFFLVSFLQRIPDRVSIPKTWVLYYPNMSGYFHLARYEMQDSATFLKTYEARMSEGDVLHIGTHPPGLFLLNGWLWRTCEASPALSDACLSMMSASSREELDALAETLSLSGVALKDSDRVTLWLSQWLTELFAVAAIVPLFLLLRQQVSTQTSWLIAASWPLVPSLNLFLPKSDALFPCLGLFFLFFWVSSLSHRSWFRAIMAGFIFWCGSMLSLAMVPMALIAGLYSLLIYSPKLPSSSAESVSLKTILITLLVSLITFLLLTFAMWVQFQIDLFAVWVWNYKNHAGFYEQFTRTYYKWLIANPIEAFFALGAPLSVAALMGINAVLKSPRTLAKLSWAGALVWGAIWLSGKNSGEAARLWLLFFPIALFFAAHFMDAIPTENDARQKFGVRLLVVQMIVCTMTVAAISGFSV